MRYVGFTGHKAPELHLKMLATGFPFDAVQMPLNPFDASFSQFRKAGAARVEPARHRGAGHEAAHRQGRAETLIKKGILTPEEALRYAMSLPGAHHVITGMEKPEVLQQNLKIAQNFHADVAEEMEALRGNAAATRRPTGASSTTRFRSSSTTRGALGARLPGRHPAKGDQGNACKETDNTGLPYPEITSNRDPSGGGDDPRRDFVRGAMSIPRRRGRGDAGRPRAGGTTPISRVPSSTASGGMRFP